MTDKPTYEELIQKVQELDKTVLEQQNLEKSLKESKERFSSLAEITSDWIWEVDQNGVYTYSSRKVWDVLGYDPEEILGKTPFDFTVPRQAEKIRKKFSNIARSKKKIPQFVMNCIHKNDENVLVETRGVPILNENGDLLGYRCIGRDITDHKKVEHALKTSENRLREKEEWMQLALKSAGLGIFDFNIQKNTLVVDDGWLEMLGYSPDEIKIDTETWWSWIHPEGRIKQRKAFDDHVAGRNPYYHIDEYRARSKTGDWVWLQDHGKVVEYDSDGRPLRLVGIHMNITERRQSEDKIAWNLDINNALSSLYVPLVSPGTGIGEIADLVLEKSSELTGSAQGYVAEIDPVSGDHIAFSFTKVMRSGCSLPEEELGNIIDYRSDVGLHNRLCRHAQETKEPFYTNAPSKHPASSGVPEGHPVIEKFLAVPVLLTGELIGLIALWNSSHPYTDRDLDAVNRIAEFYALAIQHKRAEEEIRQLNRELEQRVRRRTAQLESANKELEAFAYSVSHDLRAPLRHIDGFLKMLQENAGTTLNEKNRRYMKIISDAVKKMGRLIDDLLSFSRMGHHAVAVQQVDLGRLVREILHECEPDTAERNIDWHIADLPVVSGDESMLRTVMVNLISNALKFTRPRKQARIEIGSLPGQDSKTVVFVRDNGVGFDMDYADKLFGVFQRLHHAEEFEGTGIGMANVRRIIARHGGRTWAEGKTGHGATFYFSL